MKNSFYTIPIFPLEGVIFFPNTNLPLNIFEDRYISMVDYAFSKDKKIGIIQTKENNDEIFNIGCIGKINIFNETNDGRYIINLVGLNHFKIIKELITKEKFRIFQVNINKNDQFDSNKINFDKSILLNKFRIFFQNKSSDFSFDSIQNIKSSDLIKLIAMVCPFAVSEKQMLLESNNINILAQNLSVLLDFYINDVNNDKTIN